MKSFGLLGTVVAVVGLISLPAFARPLCAPAPLLAAGIPAFAALGGGAFVTKVARRFRRSTQA